MVKRRWGFGVAAVVGVICAFGFVAGVSSESAARRSRVTVAEPREPVSLGERLRAMDDALARNDMDGAISEWHAAYASALGSAGWEPLAEVADRAMRIDALSGGATRYRAEARTLYRFALFRARAARSADGLRRLAAGFSALGQIEFAERVRQMADGGV
jgi:hypothetical protein